jgi:hypothetical protein
MPGDSYAPVVLSLFLAALFVGLLIHSWALTIIAMLGGAAAIVGWLWPERVLGETAEPANV